MSFFLTVQSLGLEETFANTTVVTLTTQLERTFDFSLQRRRGPRRPGNRFEGEAWHAQLEDFDSAFTCMTSDKEQMERFFTPEVCGEIHQRWRSGGARIVLREGGLSVQQDGLILSDEQRLKLTECFAVALMLLQRFEAEKDEQSDCEQ